jgi:hypothetical protein
MHTYIYAPSREVIYEPIYKSQVRVLKRPNL